MKAIIVFFFVAFYSTANAQVFLGKFEPGWALDVAGGANMLGSTDLTSGNLFQKNYITYNHIITEATNDNPAIGLSLVGNFTLYNRRFDELDYVPYFLMQDGSLGFTPSIFIIAEPTEGVELFAAFKAGIQFYPLLETDILEESNFDVYEQWLLGMGLGVKYHNLISSSVELVRRRHDLSSRSEDYFETNIDEDVSLSNLHFNFTVLPLRNDSFYFFLDWYGRPSDDPRIKFYNVGIGLDLLAIKQFLRSSNGKL